MHDIIKIENLHLDIDLKGAEINILKGVSFAIQANKTVALVGESGSGKSILSQAILGILPNVAKITQGNIWYKENENENAIDLAPMKDNSKKRLELRGGKISIIFQEPMTSLSPLHTIGNQIQEALELHREVKNDEAMQTTIDMLELVGFPNPNAAYYMYPMELSGGLRQRAMIAMALICHPNLLIADEPTTALDVSMQARILSLLKELQKKLGMAVLLITHDLGVVANMADEVVVLYHGEIMEAGKVKDIFENPQHTYLKALLAAVPSITTDSNVKLKSLRDIEHSIPDSMKGEIENRGEHHGETMIEVKGLYKKFTTKKNKGWLRKSTNEVIAVDNINFNVKRGECLALVGESGCGKTTTLKMIVRALQPSSGEIIWHNKNNEKINMMKLKGNELKNMRPKMQMVFQDPFSSLSPRATVLNILKEPMEIHKLGNKREQDLYAAELMKLVGLDPAYLGRYPHSFSGGQRQRIGIARALALKPELLLCDEPVSALDVSVQAQVLNLLKQLRDELGLTYIFISHNLAVVRYIADRIAVMYKGKLVELATRDRLFENPIHPYTKTLLSVVPHADLDHPLDFDSINRNKEIEKMKWGKPFQSEKEKMIMLNVENNHQVRVVDGTTINNLT